MMNIPRVQKSIPPILSSSLDDIVLPCASIGFLIGSLSNNVAVAESDKTQLKASGCLPGSDPVLSWPDFPGDRVQDRATRSTPVAAV